MVKRLLKIGAVVAGVAILALLGIGFWLFSQAKTSNVGELDFANPLAIPPLVDARVDGGRVELDLDLRAGETELIDGKPAETWGANGPHLAPTIRASRGDLVAPTVTNSLGTETTTIHWHGMHLPAIADGGPHQTIEPGESWRPEWRIDQPAATLWYHPHPHRETADHIYRGLVGMFIVDDPESERLALPGVYGLDDVPVMIQDVRLSDDGELDESQSSISPTGRLGDEILVNGTHDPHFEVTTERVRLRLLNASGARVYDVGFDDRREFELVATEGGLLAAPAPSERIRLTPGERAEIVATFRPGERAVLRSFEPDLETDLFDQRFAGGDDSFDLLELRAAQRLEPSPEVPARLATLPPAGDAGPVDRSFRLSGQSSIDGAEMDMERIDEVVFAGAKEVWEVENASGTPHSFHPHDVRFRVLEYRGEPPPGELEGLKDTAYVPPGETVRMLIEFGEHTDPEHPYMYHCHILQHEDRGMMGQFTVVEPG